MAADVEKSEKSMKSVKIASAEVDNTDDAEFMEWSLFHKTQHELTCRVIPRIDNDFVIKFAFEKLDCTSVFEVIMRILIDRCFCCQAGHNGTSGAQRDRKKTPLFRLCRFLHLNNFQFLKHI